MSTYRNLMAMSLSCAFSTSLLPSATAQPRTPAQVETLLKERFPGAKTLWHGDRILAAYGARMTRGASPEEAVENWLGDYGDIFVPEGLEISPLREFKLSDGRGVFVLEQRLGGVPVQGGRVRLVVGSRPGAAVEYVSARVARAPAGGFAEPTMTAAEALAAAEAHPSAIGLDEWSEPGLAVVQDPQGGIGSLVWSVRAHSLQAAFEFHVDAFDARSVKAHSLIVHFSEDSESNGADIEGAITGLATPGLEPDTWAKTAAGCPNDPASAVLPFARVRAYHTKTGALLSETFADEFGDYSLNVSESVVDLEAALIGPAWEVWEWDQSVQPSPVQVPPIAKENVTVPAAPPTTVFLFNQSGDEYPTAHVNAHLHLGKTWHYFKERVPFDGPIAGLDDVIELWTNNNLEAECDGRYFAAIPSLILGRSNPMTPCRNGAYTSIITHEYGHYLLDIMVDIEPMTGQREFHEGYADLLGHLVHDTETHCANYEGCPCPATGCVGDPHLRQPLVRDTSVPPIILPLGNRQYPDCDFDPGLEPHTNGMVLSGAWLRILRNMRDTHGSETGLELTRQLHVDWTFLTAGGNPPPMACQTKYQSAGPNTVVEVLTADDTDGNLGNGTPNMNEILCAFEDHSIFWSDGSCVDSGGPGYSADCDKNGLFDVRDFVCFVEIYQMRDMRADCDRDGVLSVFDYICFQESFLRR